MTSHNMPSPAFKSWWGEHRHDATDHCCAIASKPFTVAGRCVACGNTQIDAHNEWIRVAQSSGSVFHPDWRLTTKFLGDQRPKIVARPD